MSKHQVSKDELAKKIYGPKRDIALIQQEYSTAALTLGDKYFQSELLKAQVQELTKRLAKLKDEYEALKPVDKPVETVAQDSHVPEVVEHSEHEALAAL